MPRRGFRNNPDFVDLVRSSMKGRLTYDEAVSEILARGFKISRKTYQRTNREIKKLDENRLEHLATVEYPQFTVDTIDTAKAVELELWDIVKQAKSNWEKITALEKIIKIRKEVAQFYDSSPVMSVLSKKLKRENVGNHNEPTNDLEEHSEADKQ